MIKIEKYIKTVLGIDPGITPVPKTKQKSLPFYLREAYIIKIARFFNREILLLEQREAENLTPEQYRKQITIVENVFNLPVVLLFEQLQAYAAKRLIEKQIAFILIGKQMYIPQLFIDLREFREEINGTKGKLLPAAQAVLFFHLLKENLTEINFKTIAERTNYAQMTITRAAKNLNENGLCRIEGGKEKKIIFTNDKRTLWKMSIPFLQNPIKRKVFIEEKIDDHLIYLSSYKALAYYTNISDGETTDFAISTVDYNYLLKNGELHHADKYAGLYSLEVWKYPPGLLANNKYTDPLSLYLIFKNDNDERVQIEIEKLISAIW